MVSDNKELCGLLEQCCSRDYLVEGWQAPLPVVPSHYPAGIGQVLANKRLDCCTSPAGIAQMPANEILDFCTIY